MDGTGEGAEEMIISTDLDVVAAIEGFDVPASGQDEAVRLASKAIRSLAQAEPTFVGGLVLRSIKTSGISTYVQWRRPDDGEIPLVPKAPLSLRNALQTFPILNSRNYELAFTKAGASTIRTDENLVGNDALHPLRPIRRGRGKSDHAAETG